MAFERRYDEDTGPRLRFYDPETRKYMDEYVPYETGRVEQWLRLKYIKILTRLGREVYYWDLRFLLTPIGRKCNDLQFILHVLRDHDGIPPDKRERSHYSSALSEYKNEFSLLQTFLKLDSPKPQIHEDAHEYLHAYYSRWVDIQPDAAKRLTFHGVSTGDFMEIFRSRETAAEPVSD